MFVVFQLEDVGHWIEYATLVVTHLQGFGDARSCLLLCLFTWQ
jgi:hypothetical protein